VSELFLSVATQLKSRSLYNPYHLKIATLDKRTAVKAMVNPFKLYIKPVWVLLLILSIAQLGFAGEAGSDNKSAEKTVLSAEEIVLSVEKTVLDSFDPLFNQVTLELSKNQQRYLSDPVAYHQFVNRVVKPLWDSRSTSSALIGRASFESLNKADQQALVDAVDNTLRRYAFEGLERYSGQLFRVVDVVVNQRASMGWVQVLMESSVIPDLHLDVLIKQVSPDRWKAVDVRFKGITYVAVKKHKFRKIIAEQGIQALISELQAKNREYFTDLCSSANIVGRPPCPAQEDNRGE
jgi:ABC-type transporter MlaC component